MIHTIRTLIRKKTFRTILVSYVFVLLIPVIISMIVYSTAISTVQKQMADMGAFSAIQFKSQTDAVLNKVIASAASLSLDPTLRAQIDAPEESSAIVRYRINMLSNFLLEYEHNIQIRQAAIYFGGSNSILTSSFRYHSGVVEQFMQKEYGFDTKKLNNIIKANPDGAVLIRKSPASNVVSNTTASPGNMLVIIRPVLSLSNYAFSGAVIMTVNADHLTAFSENAVFKSISNFLISSGKDYYLSKSGAGEIQWETSDHDRLLSDLLGYEVYVASSPSSVSGITYATAISVNEYYEPIRNIIAFIIAYIVICLIGGVLAAFIAAKKNYSPIEQLLQFVSSKQEGGEFQIIETALKNAADKEKVYERYQAEQNESARENVLASLMKKRSTDSEYLNGMLRLHNIEIPGDRFAAVTFYIDDYTKLYFGKENISEEERGRLTKIILRSITEELLSTFSKAYVTKVESAFACIVCLNSDIDPSLAEQRIKETLAQAVQFIEDNFGLSILAAISPIVDTISELPSAYTYALDAVEYATLMNDAGKCISYREMIPVTQAVGGGFLDKKRRLLNLLIEGKPMEAADAIDDMIDEGLFKNEIGMHVLKRRMFLISTILCENYDSMRDTLGEDRYATMNPEKSLHSVRTASDLSKAARCHLEALNEMITEEDQKSENLGAKIKDYIDRSIRDPNLDITYICDHFELSPSYVSRIFKRQVGLTVLEYINDIRIREAKRLLATTKLNIKEISEEVGYRNPWTLTRTLRRKEGLSPIAYRETIEN